MGKRKSNEDNIVKKPSLKVKLKLGKSTVSERNIDVESDENLEVDIENDYSTDDTKSKLTYEEEEEIWLDALEKGELDDSGGIKKDKDTSLMTARQKSLMAKSKKTTSKKVVYAPLLTEEDIKKREERNKKRKLQAVKKAEESQKITIQRLVKHQSGKLIKNNKEKQKKTTSINSGNVAPTTITQDGVKMVIYLNNKDGITITYPEGVPSDFIPFSPPKTIANKCCCVCKKPKKYNCSKTKLPLCSLQCYKLNLNNNTLISASP